ncbi:LOW QUALITY PROTEIN: Mitochondrial inner membrane protein Mitofilin [Dillenia turbinata]|uniref:Mitochondrial inner membrane protein Mitofilin n=1 Tax=Dillenia turbinata TaxID=194707 RepID=A0AAN8V5W5_9MAGN
MVSVCINASVTYQSGYLDKWFGKEERHSSSPVNVGADGNDSNSFQLPAEEIAEPKNRESGTSSSVMEETDKDAPRSHHHQDEDFSTNNNESQVQINGISELPPEENVVLDHEKELPEHAQSSIAIDDQDTISNIFPRESKMTNVVKQNEEDVVAPTDSQTNAINEEALANQMPPEHLTEDNKAKDAPDNSTELSTSLDAYYLKNNAEQGMATSLDQKGADGQENTFKGKEASTDDLKDACISNDGTEKRQAGMDAQKFTEEKRALNEKHEKDLRDARARELMYAEKVAILDKERVEAAAAIKSLQEKAEDKLKTELEKKVEEEAENELKKAQELAKAELAAVIAREKASQIEKIAEADLHGALALKDSLSKGLPIETERKHGSMVQTQLQLNKKLERTTEALGMIPPGGGGILTHTVAHITSWLEVKEVDYSDDGIESAINRVDKFLAEGKLVEAASFLEEGVCNSTAAKVLSDWVKKMRNRAIAEQAVFLLESYATSVSLT